MKNVSIRVKLTIWFSLALIVVLGITFALIMWASSTVLRNTIRDYLIGTVEENVDKIRFVEKEGDTEVDIFIPYEEGFLEVDMDFMGVVNNVHTALYTEDGAMLYGENPLSKVTGDIPFKESHTWRMSEDGVDYDLYDRKLNVDLPNDASLWIRGIVPETESKEQMRSIMRISLILMPVLIVIAVLSGYLLSGRLLRPIRKIETTADQIAKDDDLSRRIDVGNSNDEIGRLAKVFNNMLDSLQRTFEAEKQFTSDASHELRTPTSVILAQTEYTLDKERSNEEYVEALQVVQKQGNRMKELIGDMLDYTRLDQHTERYPFTKIDLTGITVDVVEQMKLLGEKGITLTDHIESGIVITGNQMLIVRLLQNLIGNAYRYGKENGSIFVSLKKEENGAVLSVQDDGVGIAPEDQEKIFDRFYRGDASRNTKGTGLGLAMVKKIAELHGAEVKLESEVGKGSTFSVIF